MSTLPLFHISQQLGAVQVPGKNQVQFKLYIPPNSDPHISSVHIVGPFADAVNRDVQSLSLTKAVQSTGTFWSLSFDKDLDDGFYEYQYFIEFDDRSTRLIADPCARYSGSGVNTSGFVIGGSQVQVAAIPSRLPTRDLIVYEMHAGDFTAEYREDRAPFDAILDKLDHLVNLGINAIEILPWTAFKNKAFDWGYVPFQYFAVEYLYANGPDSSAEKISRLKRLINACHAKGIHVILDGVFNHCDGDFPYRQLYRDIASSPYTAGDFGEAFSGLQELDFANDCTQDFIRDVCLYWISVFKIDGIRFDAAKFFNVSTDHKHGIHTLLQSIETYCQQNGIQNFTMTIEWLDIPAADFVLNSSATSFWDNDQYQECFNQLGNSSNRLSVEYFRALNNTQYVLLKNNPGNADFPQKVATRYLSNHDHSTVTWQAGSYDQSGAAKWYRTQPHAIALLMSPGCPLMYHGAEMAESYFIPEMDDGTRVRARPLHWHPDADQSGGTLFKLYSTLIRLRRKHAALRSANFYPASWDAGWTELNDQGFGIDLDRGLVIFHRWGPVVDDSSGAVVPGKIDLFNVLLNFSGMDQEVTVHVERNGDWMDLDLTGDGQDKVRNAVDNKIQSFKVESFWGHVLHMQVDS